MDIRAILRDCQPIYCMYMKTVEAYNRFRYKTAKKNGKETELIAQEYYRYTGKVLRDPPVSYTEKIQFAKMNESTPEKGLLSDKYAVRDWVAQKIGEEYLIPLIGAWDKFEDIPWDKMPDKFVLKTNHGSGTNVIVKDKTKEDLKKLKDKINFWLSLDFAYSGKGFEMHYSYIEPKVIAEEFVNDSKGELNDYKFLCFNGEPYFCWVDVGRQTDHRRNVYDMDWVLQPWNQFYYAHTDEPLAKPDAFEEMKRIASVLAKGFGHVRVDLYDVDGKIYFGEMTFTNGKGFELINPEEYNDMLGALWK